MFAASISPTPIFRGHENLNWKLMAFQPHSNFWGKSPSMVIVHGPLGNGDRCSRVSMYCNLCLFWYCLLICIMNKCLVGVNVFTFGMRNNLSLCMSSSIKDDILGCQSQSMACVSGYRFLVITCCMLVIRLKELGCCLAACLSSSWDFGFLGGLWWFLVPIMLATSCFKSEMYWCCWSFAITRLSLWKLLKFKMDWFGKMFQFGVQIGSVLMTERLGIDLRAMFTWLVMRTLRSLIGVNVEEGYIKQGVSFSAMLLEKVTRRVFMRVQEQTHVCWFYKIMSSSISFRLGSPRHIFAYRFHLFAFHSPLRSLNVSVFCCWSSPMAIYKVLKIIWYPKIKCCCSGRKRTTTDFKLDNGSPSRLQPCSWSLSSLLFTMGGSGLEKGSLNNVFRSRLHQVADGLKRLVHDSEAWKQSYKVKVIRHKIYVVVDCGIQDGTKKVKNRCKLKDAHLCARRELLEERWKEGSIRCQVLMMIFPTIMSHGYDARYLWKWKFQAVNLMFSCLESGSSLYVVGCTVVCNVSFRFSMVVVRLLN